MPRTVDEGFRDFLASLTPSDAESEKAMRHRASIEACLKSNFTLKRFFRTGSFGNGTSIYRYSDVDYFASVATEELKRDSSASLRQFREVLESRFPNTGVHVSSPAVRVPFGTGPNEVHEITPADFVEERYGSKIYDIPDGRGGWMKSSPDAQNYYVHKINEKLGWKIKPVVRFLKAWKYFKQVPISSFYLELRVAKYAESEASIVYDIDVERVLALLANNQLAAMQDPAGISGYILPCSSEANLQDALSKLETARVRAAKAREAEQNGDTKSAFYWWDLLYDNRFPSYYR
ncbi:MAG: hypothetical protein LLG20_00375 [Acidobacteriales bacterium]|nr:hypothetical protein [Terriglobales bacterium]